MSSVIASAKNNARANAQTTGVTVTHGFTLANGDVLYAFVGQGDDPGTGWASSSGGTWQQLANAAGSSGNDMAFGCLRRVVTDAGSEPSTYTFTRAGNNATDNLAAIVVQVRGAELLFGPEDQTTAISAYGTNDFTPDNVDITTQTKGALLLIAHLAAGAATAYAGGDARTAGAPASPSGMSVVNSEVYSDGTNTFALFLEVAKLEDAGAAGAKSIGSWTGTADDATSEHITIAVAVRAFPAIAQATETDLAQPVTALQTYALDGVDSIFPARLELPDTVYPDDVALVFGAGGQAIGVGQSTESDLAQALTALKAATLGQAAETDAAQAAAPAKARAVGEPGEIDLAQAVSSGLPTLGQVSETDTAQAATHAKSKAIGQPQETDLTQPITALQTYALDGVDSVYPARLELIEPVYPEPPFELYPPSFVINMVTEIDFAQAIGLIGGPAAELIAVIEAEDTSARFEDIPQGSMLVAISAPPAAGQVNQVVETDTAQAITAAKRKAVAQATETDLAQAAAHAKARALGEPGEIDFAQPISFSGYIIAVGQALETDAAQAISWAPKARLVGQVVESDLAQPASHLKSLGIELVLEIEVAQAVSGLKAGTLGIAAETENAQAIAHLKARTLGLAEETDLAQALAHFKLKGIGQALETDTALPVTPFIGALDLIFNIVERSALFQLALLASGRFAVRRDENGNFAATRDQEVKF